MTRRPHRYQSCRDQDCPLPYCRVWKECWDELYMPRYDEGFADGLKAKEPEIVYVEVSSS